MPQFELESPPGSGSVTMIRALHEVDAVQRADICQQSETLVVTETDGLDGWRTVVVDGHIRARIRPHQRMQFRRD